MFKIFRRPNSTGLLTSRLYDESGFYQAFARDLKHAQHEVIIESPYLTLTRTNQLLPVMQKLVRCGVKVHINTRNPNHHDEYLRIQAWMSLKRLRAAGIKAKTCNDYRHRKLAIIDGAILWEGSLNIFSQNHSREIMRRTQSPELCQQMVRFTSLNRWAW